MGEALIFRKFFRARPVFSMGRLIFLRGRPICYGSLQGSMQFYLIFMGKER